MIASLAFASILLSTPSIDTSRIDQIARSYVSNRQFSGSLLVAREGKVLFHKAYGMASWDLNVPNRTNTRFRLGSIVKQFTAASILILIEQGKLKLNDPIKSVIKEAPEAWNGITIRHLLHHESGIPDLLGFKDSGTIMRLKHSRDQLLKRFIDLPLEFEPGKKHWYSNSGYILLGMVIERVSGMSYESFLRKHLFEVAGMKDSGSDSSNSIIPNRAVGYVRTKDHFAPAEYVDMSIPLGAGVLLSTTGDLLKWEVALFGNKILQPKSLAVMLAPLDGITPSDSGVGMGQGIGDFYGHRQIFFGGGIQGFNSSLLFDPVDKTVIVALSNVNTSMIDPLCAQVSAVSRGEKVVLTSERKEIKLSESVLKPFIGKYAINLKTNMNIGYENGNLYLQVDGQQKFVLYAEGKTRFFLRDLDGQAEFVSGSNGHLTLMWTQAGGTSRFPKVKASRTD